LAGGTRASASATTAGTRKASRQSTSPSTPPHSGASAIAAVCTAANVPTVRPRRSGATTSARPASISGVRNALATPWTARAPRKAPIDGANAHPSDATA
jgi:hypothetical protein